MVVNGEEKANVFPYFIGIFDCVASLGRLGATILVLLAIAAVIPFLTWLLSIIAALLVLAIGATKGSYLTEVLESLTFQNIWTVAWTVSVAVGSLLYLATYLKFNFRIPGYTPLQKMVTIHFAYSKHKFYDYELNVNVEYAKHAISIDENRKDFARVKWTPNKAKADKRDEHGNLYFEQVWFPGVHADVGGGYSESECRLSDVSLGWMLAAASIIPNGIKLDERVLRLFPDAAGMQHDELKGQTLWQKAFRALPNDETTMHKSVYKRFSAGTVVQHDVKAPYRPPNLSNHVDFKASVRHTTPPALPSIMRT